MAERTLTLSSAGKTYSFTGWKVGWATGPADLVAAVLAAKQWLTFTSGAPLQPAVAHALTRSPTGRAGWPDLQAPRPALRRAGRAGLDVRRPEGTYFALTDISASGWDDGMAFCLALPERAGVVADPGAAVPRRRPRATSLVRWAFCKEASVIEEALSRLGAADLAR